MTAVYTIKDLERLSGIKAHTLRIWEQRYHILNPQRNDNNIRLYSSEDLKRLLKISMLNSHGYKISHIAAMESSDLARMVRELSEKTSEVNVHIDSLVIAMTDIDEERFERIMSHCILRLGFEKTLTDVIYPFFEKVGVMWVTGTVNPAQEHFITNLIRQKLIVAIDGVGTAVTPGAKKFLLYLPEGELHEISLLFYCFILRSQGYQCIYLGQSVPLDDMLMVCDIRKPDAVITIVTCALANESTEEYIARLRGGLKNTPILLSGYQPIHYPFELPEDSYLFKTPDDFRRLVSVLF